MVADPGARPLSVDEWRELERTSAVRHEYIDGYVYAMAGGSETHSYIASNIIAALQGQLADRSCRVHGSHMAARLSQSRFTYPDVLIACSQDQTSMAKTEMNPTVVFEVLSDSTEQYDRGKKFFYYRQCSILLEYIMVNTEFQLVELYTHTDDGWNVFQQYGPDDTLWLRSVSVKVPVSLLYHQTDVPREPSPKS